MSLRNFARLAAPRKPATIFQDFEEIVAATASKPPPPPETHEARVKRYARAIDPDGFRMCSTSRQYVATCAALRVIDEIEKENARV